MTAERIGGVGLLLLLALLAAAKSRSGELPDMLWACHVSAAVLALGLLLRRPAVCAAAFLFQAAIAAPAYVLHLLGGGETSLVSLALHVSAPLLGAWACRRRRIPAAAAVWAFAAFLLLTLLCRAATPPELNVNLAFRPWDPLAFTGVWPGRIVNLAAMAALLVATQRLWNAWQGRRVSAAK